MYYIKCEDCGKEWYTYVLPHKHHCLPFKETPMAENIMDLHKEE